MLFSSNDISSSKEEIVKSSPSAIRDMAEGRAVFFNHGDVIAKVLGPVKQNEAIVYANAGCWSAHEMLMHLLSISGPAKVLLTTWTMTEYPARVILEAMTNGLILDLKCVMNVRMEKLPNVMQLARANFSSVHLAKNHAKVIVIENDEWFISMNSSQNMTENPNMETGVISTNKLISAFHKQWIEHEIEHGHKVE